MRIWYEHRSQRYVVPRFRTGASVISCTTYCCRLDVPGIGWRIKDVLSRPRFDRCADRENREEFLQDLVRQAESVEVTERVRACRDPKDDKILELAVNGRANYIVTSDDDLLDLNPFRGIAIVRPAEFLTIVDSETMEP